IYPDDKLKNNRKFMRPIKYHPMWFFDIEDQNELDHIDLEYKGYTFFAKKFLTKSKRRKRRAGLTEESPEIIVIIVSLPTELEAFEDELIKNLTKEVRDNYEEQLYEIIEAELLRDGLIKTPKIIDTIKKGTEIKKFLLKSVDKIIKDFFSKKIKMKPDVDSIQRQRAISYLTLRRSEISNYRVRKGVENNSGINLFETNNEVISDFNKASHFMINSINFIVDNQEIEILVQNNAERETKNVNVKITHVKDFFEREIMNQFIDVWFPKEELLFISPVIPNRNEFLFFQIEKENKEKLISRKIDIEMIDKIVS
ncbi:hypothetical protein LCGC14_0935900, partial [marine sediment metagenome]